MKEQCMQIDGKEGPRKKGPRIKYNVNNLLQETKIQASKPEIKVSYTRIDAWLTVQDQNP